MKRYLSAAFLAVTLLAGLTGCGGGAPAATSATEAPSETATPTPTPTSRAVPDVAGKKFPEARKILNAAGFYGSAWGKDGKKWTNTTPDASIDVVSTTPAAGTVTATDDIQINLGLTEAEHGAVAKAAAEAAKVAADAAKAEAKAKADAAKLALRYEFICGSSSSSSPVTYRSLKDVWASKHYAAADTCRVQIDGQGVSGHPVLIPSEQAIADVVAAHGGGGGGSAASDFGRVLQLCTKLEFGYVDQVVARMDWKKAEANGALALCPDAPHAAALQEVATSVKVGDGTHIVGQNMEAGTYRTKPSIKDCYWSRTTGGGGIIANDFVGFAPAGVTVTVRPGEGFQSERCGIWTKIG